jgi:F0F1-type ATP synthase alpha subunit
MFKNIKKFCNDLNDINNMGFVFKVSDDIVYARGLLRVQMSEMVNLN